MSGVLEQYLKAYELKNIVDFSLRCQTRGEFITFYIHASGKDSETLEFVVIGNELRTMPQAGTCQHPSEYQYRYPITNARTKACIMGKYCLCGTNLEPEMKP
jgi:hypothetical protein